MNDFSVDIGEAKVAALESIGKFFVVNPHLVHDRGIEIVDVHGVFDDVVAKVIGLAVGHPAFDSTAGHPDGITASVVIASVVLQ